jgi:HlyD family secretion protein
MDIQIETKPWKSRRALVAVGAALVASGAVAYFAMGDDNSLLRIERERVQISSVQRAVFQDYIPIRANVVPIATVYLDMTQAGRVEEVFVQEGALVEKGQVLARFSNPQLQLDVISREAEISEQLNLLSANRLSLEEYLLSLDERRLQMEYEIADGERRLANMERLLTTGAVSQDEVMSARLLLGHLQRRHEVVLKSLNHQKSIRQKQYSELETSATQLERSLEVTRSNLEHLTLRAPFAGQVSSFDLKVGQSLAQGERVGQVDDASSHKLEALVDEFYISRVTSGQQARFELDGQAYAVVVQKVSAEIVNGQFKLELNFIDAPPLKVRRGQTIRVSLGLDEAAPALVLKAGNYLQETGGKWVFVLDSDGELAAKREVRIGRSNPEFVEILGGLTGGESVVTSGYGETKAFDRLRLVE